MQNYASVGYKCLQHTITSIAGFSCIYSDISLAKQLVSLFKNKAKTSVCTVYSVCVCALEAIQVAQV